MLFIEILALIFKRVTNLHGRLKHRGASGKVVKPEREIRAVQPENSENLRKCAILYFLFIFLGLLDQGEAGEKPAPSNQKSPNISDNLCYFF